MTATREVQPDPPLDSLAAGAMRAATEVAREHGLPVESPRMLANDQNLLVHLSPSPVVARVATRIAWSRPDPEAWLAREVAVVAYAAGKGAPVVPPTPLVNPGPHSRNGYHLTLWTYVESDDRLASEAEVGEALARLHLALADFPTETLPDRLPVHAQIENGLSALQRENVESLETLRRLRDLHAEYSAALAEVRGTNGVIHGDAHPWNLLSTEAGWRWIDLEETGFGPQEFDLAVLATKVDDPQGALASYAATMGRPVVAQELLAPFQQIRELETVIWGLGMAVSDPGFRGTAQERLQRLLDR
jgi:Ser/Thr protein kinase RdoA (MazF antagonist)